MEIYYSVMTCIDEAVRKFLDLGYTKNDIKGIVSHLFLLYNQSIICYYIAIGITNQRETVVAWDKETGNPLNHAIGILNKTTLNSSLSLA